MPKLYIGNPTMFRPEVQEDMARWWGGPDEVAYQTDAGGFAVTVDLRDKSDLWTDQGIQRLDSFMVKAHRMDESAGDVTGDAEAYDKDLPPVKWRGSPLRLTPSLKVRNHSPTGFAWGYHGSGPAQLALAILLKLMPKPEAEARYQRFKMDTIAVLPMREDFRLSVADIMAWVTARRLDPCDHAGEYERRCRLCNARIPA